MGRKLLGTLIDKAIVGRIVKADDISALANKADVVSADRQYAAAHILGKVSDAWDGAPKIKKP